VEAAFLNAEPSTKMYIKIPDEMVELEFATEEEQQEYAILLKNDMYGNMDVALHFFKKYSGILVTCLGFEHSKTGPCIFLKYNQQGGLVMII